MSINLSCMSKILQLNNSICIIWDMVAVLVLTQPVANARLYYLSWISSTVSEAKLNLLWTTTMSTDNCSGSPDSRNSYNLSRLPACLSLPENMQWFAYTHTENPWQHRESHFTLKSVPNFPTLVMSYRVESSWRSWENIHSKQNTFLLKEGKYMNEFSLIA